MPPQVSLSLSIDQAQAVKSALELYARLSIGQLEEVTDLVRAGVLPLRSDPDGQRRLANADTIHQFAACLESAKASLGLAPGASFGIGHPHVHITGARCWETYKALAQALVTHLDPRPEFKGVDYDGVLVRYTEDPLPVARVIAPAASQEVAV